MVNKFERKEIKFILSISEYNNLLEEMSKFMKIDKYGKVLISNVYFDTPNYKLIRQSIDKPLYKEKLRVRSYGDNHEKLFVELKKKYKGIVYKRRFVTFYEEVESFLVNKEEIENKTQIIKEIDYFIKFHENILPAFYLSYEREAFYGIENEDFRITFDHNIKARNNDVFNFEYKKGFLVLPEDKVVLEVKTNEGFPTWLKDFFNKNNIKKQSFSKYGEAYKKAILRKEDLNYV